MSQESKFDQFIYGKFVAEKDSEYRLVSYSENLNNNISELEDIHEKIYYFWGSQSSDFNHKAVGICRNNTRILPKEKQILLIQAAPAFNKDKGIFSRGGSRSFFQHRYIFVSETEITGFNNQICRLLGYLGKMSIPTFSNLNQLDDSEQKSWLLGPEDFESLLATETTEKKVRETIEKVWKKLKNSEQKILLKALDVILNGKRLLLTDQNPKKTRSLLLLLDNLLLFLPTNLRNEIYLAIGSVDPEYCKWAQIIVKLDGSSIRSLPENMVWLDFSKEEFEKEEYLDHEYVKDFIAPNKDKSENLITICGYLDKTTKDDSDNFAWEFQKIDGWLKLNHPSLDFIFNYPAEEPDKIEILGKYIPRMEEKVQSFLDKFGENLSTPDSKDLELLEFLWEALPIPENNGDLMKTLLCKIYLYLPDKFLEIVEAGSKFSDSLEILIGNQFIDSLADENLRNDILQELQNACLELIRNISQGSTEDLYNKSGGRNTSLHTKYLPPPKPSTKNYPELEKLIIGCEKIFRSEKEKFKLWDLALVGRMTSGDFKRLFIERLFPTFHVLERETFEQSNLKECWEKYFHDSFGSLNFYLLEKDKGIFHIPEIANSLKLSNSEVSELYMTCLKSHSPTCEQSLPLLESAIEKSVSFLEEKLKFQANDFMAVYQWFNSQYFQDKSPDKPGKFPGKVSIFSKLVTDSNSNRWISWQELSNILYKDDIEQTIFLDKTIGKYFPVEVLEAWLTLLDNHPESKEVEAKFMASKAWSLLNRKTLRKMRENLTGTYQKYVGKFIQLAIKHEHLDLSNDTPVELISGELIEYITEIWLEKKKSIDKSLWKLLNSERVLPKLSDKDCLKLIDVHWRLGADSLSLSLTNLYERAKNFSLEEKESLMNSAKEIVNQCEDLQTMKKIILYMFL
ncbi:hypothetical protein [Okeania sp. SIO2B3]|uniref:hypothetical protein n=1 Tax=Okeania sp. SIO2B3 TaxID=2607784 RepID=UPI0013BEC83E|nr:hypothetical protein [Okeania sp. SIO2B3]NET41856.1 hypothetical protein [Okeania sp. SIO2B3]